VIPEIERLELLVLSSEARLKAATIEADREDALNEYKARSSQLRRARRESATHCEGWSECHRKRVTKCDHGHQTCTAHANSCERCNRKTPGPGELFAM
jgi:hypothetical protein